MMFPARRLLERKQKLDVALEFRVFLGWAVRGWWRMARLLVRFPQVGLGGPEEKD